MNEENREKTNILFLVKEKEKDQKHYVLTLQHTKGPDGKDIWFELDSRFNEAVALLGRLNDLFDKYGINNLDLLDSILSVFKEHIHICEYGEKTRQHHLKAFNSDFAYRIGMKDIHVTSEEINSTDFQRLKIFLPKENIEYMD